jgi:hypothetical protein
MNVGMCTYTYIVLNFFKCKKGSTYGGEERGLQGLVRKPERKRPLGRPRRRWEDDIKLDIQEVACGGYGLDRAGSGQGQVAGNCDCGNEPSGSIKCSGFLD